MPIRFYYALPAIPTTIIITGFLLKLGDEVPACPDDDPSICSLSIDSLSSSFPLLFPFDAKSNQKKLKISEDPRNENSKQQN
jgi:hypothetical protein